MKASNWKMTVATKDLAEVEIVAVREIEIPTGPRAVRREIRMTLSRTEKDGVIKRWVIVMTQAEAARLAKRLKAPTIGAVKS